MTRTTVFIVEDELIVALDLKRNLEKLGYQVAALCASGEDAVSRVNAELPDIVLMDINLGRDAMPGTEAAQQIMDTSRVPVIFLTAYAEENVLACAEASMPYGYLLKPFELRELDATLRMALARHRTEQRLQLSEERLRLAIDTAELGVWEWQERTRSFVTEGHFNDILGTGVHFFEQGRESFLDMIHVADRPQFLDSLNYSGHFRGVVRIFVANGEMRWISLHARHFKDQQRLIGVINDISHIHHAEERISYLAYHDALTGLANRHLFQDHIEQAIDAARLRKGRVGLLFIDLDGFKTINDSLGHNAGDELLITTARRLERTLRMTDIPIRLGGDEFLVIIPDLIHLEDCAVIANHLLGTLCVPVRLEACEDPVTVTASIGIAVYPDHAHDGTTLFKACDTAMYSAKAAGRNGFCWFSNEMAQRARHRLILEQGLVQARLDKSITLLYQPQIDLADGRVVGVEALARWNHPELGAIPPAQFIPVAEETGSIESLGAMLLEEACRQGQRWSELGLDLRVSVNVSVRQLASSRFIDQLDAIVERTGFPARRLELEITESVMISLDRILPTLSRIRERGISLSIDDFGTGFSCLSMLQHLPIERLKIDKSFVEGLPHNGNSLALTLAILSVANSLGLDTIAEGVETELQWQQLAALGCNGGQGWLFAPALPADEIPLLLARTPFKLP